MDDIVKKRLKKCKLIRRIIRDNMIIKRYFRVLRNMQIFVPDKSRYSLDMVKQPR